MLSSGGGKASISRDGEETDLEWQGGNGHKLHSIEPELGKCSR